MCLASSSNGARFVKRLACALATLESVSVRTYWGDDGFWVCPKTPGGFDVSVEFEGNRFVVATDTGSEYFGDAEPAIKHCVYSLTEVMRLQRTFRGNQVVRSELQTWNGTNWVSSVFTGRVFIPFWRRKHVENVQNNVLTVSQAEAAVADALQV